MFTLGAFPSPHAEGRSCKQAVVGREHRGGHSCPGEPEPLHGPADTLKPHGGNTSLCRVSFCRAKRLGSPKLQLGWEGGREAGMEEMTTKGRDLGSASAPPRVAAVAAWL